MDQQDIDRTLAAQAEGLVRDAAKQVRNAGWAGHLVSIAGALLALLAVGGQLASDRLSTAEFVTSLAVGAFLALAGPVIFAYSAHEAHHEAAQLSDAQLRAAAARR